MEEKRKGFLEQVSFITTVYNEAKSIKTFLETLLEQTIMPGEIIIVDGGSNDGTVEIIVEYFKSRFGKSPQYRQVEYREEPVYHKSSKVLVFECYLNNSSRVKLFQAYGARIAEGRNIAIENAGNEFICVSDAGCILSENWVEEISGCFSDNDNTLVMGGYNFPYIENFIQSCLAVCVMPRKEEIRSERFMPSSRNISFSRTAWKEAGGYPQNMDYGEDMKFNFNLKKTCKRISFNPRAEVFWNLRESLVPVFRQFFRYAKGDAIGRMYPGRHLARYVSFALMILLIALAASISPWFLAGILPLLLFFMYKPYLRINYFLENSKVFHYSGKVKSLPAIKAGIFFTIPLMMAYIEAAKMLGYLYGTVVRRRF